MTLLSFGIFVFISSVLLFIFLSIPVYNVFLFMFIIIQALIFLVICSKEYFFTILLFIIYLGAILVLFLFVILIADMYKNENNFFIQKKIISVKNIYLLFFILLLVNCFSSIFILFYEWIFFLLDNTDYLLIKNYVYYLKDFKNIDSHVVHKDMFLFSENIFLEDLDVYFDFCIEENLENFYNNYLSFFCKDEFFIFNIWEGESLTYFWCLTLFIRDAGLLYLCGFLLFSVTVGVIFLALPRKQIFRYIL